MNSSRFLLHAVLTVISTASLHSQDFQNGQAARYVLGQPDFTTRQTTPVEATRFAGSRGVAVSPVTGKVFVAEGSNNRILRFASAEAAGNGSLPEIVLGKMDFTTGGFDPPSARTFDRPHEILVDAEDRLWVADGSNNRVLRFDNASTLTTYAAADGVLGQPNFIANASFVTTRAGCFSPTSIFLDHEGRLWVADFGNYRVLRYDDAASKPDGADADGVLGQTDYVTRTTGLGSNKVAGPFGITGDTEGTIWVSDRENHRILRFDDAASKSDGANADGVLGQPDFSTNTLGVSIHRINFPHGIHLEAGGALWVADARNHRVLRFSGIAAKQDGADADLVLGQTDFDTGVLGLAADKLEYPYGLTTDGSGNLWVADSMNHRVLFFELPQAVNLAPDIEVTTMRRQARAIFTVSNASSKAASYLLNVRIQNPDSTRNPDSRVPENPPASAERLQRIFRLDGVNVTRDLLRGGGSETRLLAPGEQTKLVFGVRQKRPIRKARTIEVSTQASNLEEKSQSAVGTARIRLRP